MSNNNCKLHHESSLYSPNARGEYGMYAPMCTCIHPGDFSFTKEDSREMLKTAYDAICSIEGGWEFLKDYIPQASKGFMFSTPPPKLEEINKEITKRYDGHSGASYGATMTHMESIAKKGWDAYVDMNLTKHVVDVDKKIIMARAMSGGHTDSGFAKNLFQTVQGVRYDSLCPHGDPFYACMSCSH